ncbi:MAG TPA: septum formation initiator family protein [Syntrophales bacterium]|nr:septum formation initiator family protein [Syntrophales bacterium]HOM06322.1 septum formation initiator family protein [Syntrophales bacterium]HON99239.1 septum formation initiator family protein [Syntrophales bacterium]HPC00064.1 septum formation initiator family protein [Syntrophales bacterium]HPQ05697.1 septum formation initiator family protein [Syntrophales bacterium]
MKIGRILLVVVLIVLTGTVFGERGLRDNYALRDKLTAVKRANEELRRENEELRRTARLLREDLAAVEKVARNELGLVKKGDIVYRFVR